MALPTCVKCGKMNMFEVHEAEPKGSAFKLIYLQCSICGGVAGVLEYFNSGAALSKIENQIAQLASARVAPSWAPADESAPAAPRPRAPEEPVAGFEPA